MCRWTPTRSRRQGTEAPLPPPAAAYDLTVLPLGEAGKSPGLDKRFHARNHLDGTMLPIQAHPEFGMFYLEFEEHFAGFNFGGGNCQLDLEAMRLDWPCGERIAN